MFKHLILKLALISGLASIALPALAGQFRCVGYGNGAECAENIKDLVTDKFLAKYPATKYTIIVLYDFQKYSDGGGVGFSIAGVAPLLKDGKNGNWNPVPEHRFISTLRIDSGVSISAYESTQKAIQTIRRSVEHLMEACDRLPNCDVLK